MDLSTSTAPNAPNGQGKNQNVENAQEEEPDVDPANENADDIEDGDDVSSSPSQSDYHLIYWSVFVRII